MSLVCCVCGDEPEPTAPQLKCAQDHLTCGECMNGLARNDVGIDGVRKWKGGVRCPWRGAVGAGKVDVCSAAPWELSKLRGVLGSDTYAELLEGALSIIAHLSENEAALGKRLAAAETAGGGVAARAEAAAAAAVGKGEDERIAAHRLAIIESCLTLRCPRCATAFLDYSGCDAVQCSRPGCGCSFCALCLKDCGVDAHAHVLAAKHHGGPPSMFGGYSAFMKFHKERRTAAVVTAIAAIRGESDAFKVKLRAAVEKDMTDEKPVPDGIGMLPPQQQGGRGGGGGGPVIYAGGGGGEEEREQELHHAWDHFQDELRRHSLGMEWLEDWVQQIWMH